MRVHIEPASGFVVGHEKPPGPPRPPAPAMLLPPPAVFPPDSARPPALVPPMASAPPVPACAAPVPPVPAPLEPLEPFSLLFELPQPATSPHAKKPSIELKRPKFIRSSSPRAWRPGDKPHTFAILTTGQ
jgi:hypothetical protein